MTDPTFCDIKKAAEMLGVSTSQVRRFIEQADLPCYQPIVRGQLLFSTEDIKAWLRKHRKPHKKAR